MVMDQTKTDAEVLHALISYDFGIQAVEHTMENTGSDKTLLLEHNGSEGNLIFIVDKPEFLIGNQRKQTERLQIPRKSVEIIVGLSGKMAVI